MSNIKHHRISFQDGPIEKAPEMLEDELMRIKGVKKVNVDFGKGEVSMEYGARSRWTQSTRWAFSRRIKNRQRERPGMQYGG